MQTTLPPPEASRAPTCLASGPRAWRRLRLAVLYAILGALPLATARAQATGAPPATLATRDMLVPIHTMPGDPAYGMWAAGPGWKASFHDGFAFHPRPPSRSMAAPVWRWTTVAASVGRGELLATARPVAQKRSEHRCELALGGLTEVYDVRSEGVEQSFVLAQRPTHAGDLVIVGRIDTPLTAAPLADRHGALVFCDAGGHPTVGYGAAFAIDALGQRVPATTGYDGQQITLRVPAGWMASAAYPVTVDPLTSPLNVSSSASPLDVVNVDVCSDGESAQRGTMVVYTIWYANFDADTYAVLCNADLGSATLVLADVSSGYSGAQAVAFVGGADRWVVGLWRGAFSVYLHDKGSTQLNGGSFLALPALPGSFGPATEVLMDVGGVAGTGTKALAVLHGHAVLLGTEAFGVLLDAATKTWSAPFILADQPVPPPTGSRLYPRVNQTGDAGGWVTTYYEGGLAKCVRVTPAGGKTAPSVLPALPSYPYGSAKLSGRGGRYLLTTATNGQVAETFDLQVTRFDFTGSSAANVVRKSLASGIVKPKSSHIGFVIVFDRVPALGSAYDAGTLSHWAVDWQSPGTTMTGDVARLGYTAGKVETGYLYTRREAPNDLLPLAVCHDPGSGWFIVVYADPDGAVKGRLLEYSKDAKVTSIGAGCGGVISTSAPWAGSELFRVQLGAAEPSTPAALLIGFASAKLPLSSIGMGSCTAYVDPAKVVTLAAATDRTGAATTTLPLPDSPAFLGDAYAQWLYLAPRANVLGALVTDGIKIQVR